MDGTGVPTETWEGLTDPGVAAAAVIDLWNRTPCERQARLGPRPSLRQLARSAMAFEVSDGLMDALRLADPEAARHLSDLAQQERERYA